MNIKQAAAQIRAIRHVLCMLTLTYRIVIIIGHIIIAIVTIVHYLK